MQKSSDKTIAQASDSLDSAAGTLTQKSSDKSGEKTPRNHRELAQAIFAQCDPVQLGRELLESDSDRGASVKARVWETLVNFAFGQPATASRASATPPRVRVVWNLSDPPRDSPERK